ncbi:MAG: HD domain-containing protein [Pirellulales bacterium]
MAYQFPFQPPTLSHDPIHGYIPITTSESVGTGETSEFDVLRHPWLQRMRQIHQLQTAWWVFPSAEHTRFQHVLGAMHLASRLVRQTYPSLVTAAEEVGERVPTLGYVETLLRMAGLLHDVGHGPFGHFFDTHFLSHYGLTHETLGAEIIERRLGELLRGLRGNPHSRLADDEILDPTQVSWLIVRPTGRAADESAPRWLKWLRALLSGIYTIDNMDFVLRDAYFTGYAYRSFDLERIIQYTFFTPHGLTIHDRGVDALVRFMTVRSELFRTVYFHRTVRAIDLQLADLFAASRELLFPGNPRELLDEYLLLTDHSLLVDVQRWGQSDDPRRQELGRQWQDWLQSRWRWWPVCQRHVIFGESDNETASIFSDHQLVAQKLSSLLPAALKSLPLRVDIARHIYRPNTVGPAQHQNFLYDSATERVRPLTDNLLFRHLPISQRICRVYAESLDHAAEIAAALDTLLGPNRLDDLTNM